MKEKIKEELQKRIEVKTNNDRDFLEAIASLIEHFYEKGYNEGKKETQKERA